jgi:hypothetical protein
VQGPMRGEGVSKQVLSLLWWGCVRVRGVAGLAPGMHPPIIIEAVALPPCMPEYTPRVQSVPETIGLFQGVVMKR